MANFLMPLLAAVSSVSPAELPASQLDRLMNRIVRSSTRSMAALVEVTVSPDGRVLECSLQQSRGDERSAARVCSALERVEFRPALDPEGYEVHAKKKLSVGIESDEGTALWTPDVLLQVEKLPGGEQQADVFVNILVDENGVTRSCVGPSGTDVAILTQAACEWLSTLSVEPLEVSGGEVVPFITTVPVRFVAERPDPS